MGMAVTLFLSIATTTIVYAVLGQGGGVSALIFFGILLVGASIRILQPKS